MSFISSEEWVDWEPQIEAYWRDEDINSAYEEAKEQGISYKKWSDKMAVKDIIKDKLKDREWTFGEIADVSKTVEQLAEYCYEKMSAKEKIDYLWDKRLIVAAEFTQYETTPGSGPTWAFLLYNNTKYYLQIEIATIIKEELSGAKIVFKEDENEISKESMGGKSHQELPSNEKGQSEE